MLDWDWDWEWDGEDWVPVLSWPSARCAFSLVPMYCTM